MMRELAGPMEQSCLALLGEECEEVDNTTDGSSVKQVAQARKAAPSSSCHSSSITPSDQIPRGSSQRLAGTPPLKGASSLW